MKKYLISLLGVTVLLFSCKKDIENIEKISDGEVVFEDLDQSHVIPLINSRTTLAEIEEELADPIADLADEGIFLSTFEDGLYFLRFDTTAESARLNDYYEIPDVNQVFSLDVPQGNLLLPLGATIGWDTTFFIGINPPFGAELETIEISEGQIDLNISHDINQQITGNVRINSLSNLTTGEVFEVDFLTNPSSESSTFNNHVIEAMNNGGERNVIEVTVSITGRSISPVLTGNSINIDLFFGNFFLEYIDGLVTEVPIGIPEGDLDFDFFDDAQIDELRLADPRLEIDVFSSLGMPAIMDFNVLEFGYPDGSVEDIDFTDDFITRPVNNRSDIPNNPTLSEFIIDRNNSRIDELINTAPNSLIYDVDVRAGNGNEPEFFFLTSESRISADISAILPLDLQLLDYTFEDTVAIDLADLDSTIIDSYDRASLKLIFENGLPLDVAVQAIFLDENGVVLDSVYRDEPELILANDNINAEGEITRVEEVTSFVELDREGFLNLLNADRIAYRIVGSTSQANTAGEPRFVRILSSYSFGLRAGLEADITLDLNEITEDEDEN